MIKGINPQVTNPSEDNYVVKSTKEFFAAHRTTLKIASNLHYIFISISGMNKIIFRKPSPPFKLDGRFALNVIGMAACMAFSESAKRFEKSLEASDVNHKYSEAAKEIVSEHSTMVKIVQHIPAFLLGMFIAEDLNPTSQKFLPLTSIGRCALISTSLAGCIIFLSIAKNFEKSLAVSDANHKYSRVDAETLEKDLETKLKSPHG